MIAAVRTFIPIRSFDGMSRLGSVIGPADRRVLAMRLARRTVSACREAGTIVSVITNDAAVRRWADELGVAWIAEPSPEGLDAAARTGVASAAGDPWLVIHADLPAVGPDDVRAACSMVPSDTVLAPSHDGGTSLIGGTLSDFPFRYGPGSFHRHVSALGGHAAVLIRPGLALDLDRPRDLDAFRRLGHLADSRYNAPGSTAGDGR